MSDSALLPQIARGEEGAFAAAVDRYGRLLWALALRHGVGEAEAEDAVQDIFLELWRSADRYDPGRAREVTFVAMIARRRLIDRRRRLGREREGLEALAREIESAVEGPAPSEDGVDAQRALRAIAELSADERRVLGLSVAAGYSHSEIAARTGLPLGTVKSHLRRGLERVRSKLVGERR